MEGHNSYSDAGSKPASYPRITEISLLACNDSCEKRAMAFEETGHSLPSSPTSKFSRRRAMSQIASPIVDFDVAIAEKPYTTLQGRRSEEGPTSYYIINPRVPGLAWYLTKEKSNSDTHEYEVERVPTHVVDIRLNHTGYLVETAIRDDVTGVAGGQSVSWTPKCQNGWSTISTSSMKKSNDGTEAEPGKRDNRFERCDSEADTKTRLHNESTIILDRQDIPLITERIIHQLNAAGLKQNCPCTAAGSRENDKSSSQENREFENIIEATLMEFKRSLQGSDSPKTDEENTSTPSKLPAQFALGNDNQHIELRRSVVADPEITLSIPQTPFTTADSNRKINDAREKLHKESPTLTTLVSPQSATSITWAKLGGYLGRPSLSPESTNSPSDENSESMSQTRRTSSCHDDKQDQELETSQASIGSSSVASTITSFPKLLSRHCTREWIKPLTSLEDTSTDLSYRGVDDHTNRVYHNHQASFTETPVPMCWPGDSFQSPNTSGYFTDEAPNTRRTTVSQSSLTNVKSFGTQIGSAAHRRRSTSTYNSKASPTQDHFLPNILGKIFVSRNREAPESPGSKQAIDSGALAHHNSPAHVHMHVRTP
ncbi:hypothetical protein TrVGV298_004207 [Trichoderma virens]|nr:hypothetical protein TrVGV298_004207 [Trichoderma virens]